MVLFQRGKKGSQCFVVIFDIGNASIGGALVELGPGKAPEIIFTTRRDIPFQEKLNFDRFLSSMQKTLEELFILVQKAGGGMKVEQVYCILASPWYASQTRLIRYNQETPFTVTKSGLDKLIQKEIALFRDSKLFVRSKVGDPPPEIMESKNIQIRLNGYEMKNPYGKQTSELEAAVYISMIPKSIRVSIVESIAKFWHLKDPHFSSFSFTAFDTIRDIFPDESSFFFIDISGEVTDISLARDNVLLQSISFPSGKNTVIRALVEKMKMTHALAISELELYSARRSTPEHTKAIEEVLGETTKEWQTSFRDALLRFAKEFPIPRTIFYTADDNNTEWFERAIRETNFKQFATEGEAFTVRSLGNAFLGKFVRLLEPDFQDPFLAIETIFVNKFSSLTEN
ncbi:MAG: hypothetical protein AAB869_01420 [Patescibacteria group bacterium]